MARERRQFRRYTTGLERVRAVVASGRKRLAVMDLSRGGLMFEYTPDAMESLETKSIDIIKTDQDQISLKGICCETVYDVLTLAHDKSFNGAILRMRGLKFVKMTKKQSHALAELLDCCRKV